MFKNRRCFIAIVLVCLSTTLFHTSCSNKKNTAFSRFYHSVNTRYNAHFNANEAYKESMKAKEQAQEEDDNLSKLVHIYPEILDSADLKHRGAFTTTIDKTTKAIKLHSIKTRPGRNPNKRGDKKYQQWVNQKEFNPFLVNSWMLLAKGEFQEGNYLRAITTFMYITKIYEYDKKIVSESKLWIARAYSEMGWTYEAENVLRKMEQNDEIHHQLLGMYASIKANIHIRNENYPSAIPYLEEAIKKEKNGSQKRRNRYLLGQLYAKNGENKKAYKAFGNVRGFSTPPRYAFNAKLRQLEVSGESQAKTISELKKMARNSKNEEYLDQVYTALGEIYINNLDTANAITNYAKAIEKSTRGGYDKALAQIKLGAIYFDQQKYVNAQPCYSEALPQLKKADEYYELVSLRAEVLDQLVVHARVVNEQDSLLMLANLPEDERLDVINKHIEKIKKEEELAKKEEELERRKEHYNQQEYTSWDGLAQQDTPAASQGGFGQQAGSDFYFYNKQIVEQGKVAFQRKWGRRALEDNWRRKDKATSLPFGNFDEDTELVADGEKLEPKDGDSQGEEPMGQLVTDIHSVEYYLQQLPMTDAAKEASYKLVENGLFNMALIYKNLLEDNGLAITTFTENLNRFPNTPNKEEIYYQLFLIYLRMGDESLMALYRNMMINEFPSGKYAIPLADANYAWNFKYMSKMQEDLYQETYKAYLAGDVQKVRKNYEDIQTKFPFVDLMPKFTFLNSLTYAQTKDAKSLEKNLTKLIADYPEADVTPMATNILKNIKNGMILLSDGTPIKGMDWTMAYTNDSIFEGDSAKVIEYMADVDAPYVLLLMFKPKSIDRNDLLYQVADYNFSNYVIQTYDLSFDENPILSSLEISGFKDFKTIKSYLNKALLADGLLSNMDKEIVPIPISTRNNKDIFPRLGLEEYMTFYTDSLAMETPQLLAYWNKDYEKLVAVIDDEPAEEPKEEAKEFEEEPVDSEIDGEKIIFPELAEKTQEKVQEEETHNDKEVNLEDVLSEDQVKIIGSISKKHDNVIDALQGVVDNPVDGLKNIFNRRTLEENLTKEEKEELKQLEKEEKERQKELKAILKAKEDSIAKVEQFRLDSVKLVEKAIQDSLQLVEKEKKEQIEFEQKERERKLKEQEEERQREIREREDARKEQLRQREEKRKQQEKEREELLRERERQRDELMKKREDERKEREKAAEELRKQKERERQELLKQRERDRKENRRR